MKILLVLTFAIVFVAALAAAQDNCNGRCATMTQCCINYGVTGVCTQKGLAGDYCGGAFYCDACVLGSRCEPREYSVWNRFKPGTGTCKGISATFSF